MLSFVHLISFTLLLLGSSVHSEGPFLTSPVLVDTAALAELKAQLAAVGILIEGLLPGCGGSDIGSPTLTMPRLYYEYVYKKQWLTDSTEICTLNGAVVPRAATSEFVFTGMTQVETYGSYDLIKCIFQPQMTLSNLKSAGLTIYASPLDPEALIQIHYVQDGEAQTKVILADVANVLSSPTDTVITTFSLTNALPGSVEAHYIGDASHANTVGMSGANLEFLYCADSKLIGDANKFPSGESPISPIGAPASSRHQVDKTHYSRVHQNIYRRYSDPSQLLIDMSPYGLDDIEGGVDWVLAVLDALIAQQKLQLNVNEFVDNVTTTYDETIITPEEAQASQIH